MKIASTRWIAPLLCVSLLTACRTPSQPTPAPMPEPEVAPESRAAALTSSAEVTPEATSERAAGDEEACPFCEVRRADFDLFCAEYTALDDAARGEGPYAALAPEARQRAVNEKLGKGLKSSLGRDVYEATRLATPETRRMFIARGVEVAEIKDWECAALPLP